MLLAFSASSASAALKIDNVALQSVSGQVNSMSGASGSVVFGATVKVTATSGSTWRVVRYRFTPAGDDQTVQQGCIVLSSARGSATVTLPTQNPSSTTNPAHGIVLPREAGNYTAHFTVTSATSCGGNAAVESPEFDLAYAVHVTSGRENDDLEAGCGLNVMLVLDESGSIHDTPGAVKAVRDAAKSFVGALSGTGSYVSIVDFARTAQWSVNYTSVTDTTIDSVFTPYIDGKGTGNKYDPVAGGTTNWQDAFDVVRTVNAQAPAGGARKADLVVFVTDGDPNTFNTGKTTQYLQRQEGDIVPMGLAQASAGEVKAQGSHVFAIGVGNAVDNDDSISRLTAVSGPTQYSSSPDNFDRADYTVVSKFAGLEAALRKIAVTLCAPSLVVTKVVDGLDGRGYQPQGNWGFTANVDVSPSGYDWRIPSGDPTPGPRTVFTDSGGIARFQWGLGAPDSQSTVGVAEQPLPFEYAPVDARCTTKTPTGEKDTATSVAPAPIPSATIGSDEFRVCEVRNRLVAGGHLTVVKQLLPAGDRGRFDILVDGQSRIESVGNGGSTGRIELAPGTHTVAERITAVQAAEDPPVRLSQYAVATRCVDQTGAVVASGSGTAAVQVPIRSIQDEIVCTISNQRTAPPLPPDTPTPPPRVPVICAYDDTSDACTARARAASKPRVIRPTTRLTIDKRSPARAHRGQTIPITITVRNTGRTTARSVMLRDSPPGAAFLRSSAGQLKFIRNPDGSVRWRLGDLKPGESRTVRTGMTIRRRASGRMRNTAIVSAVNASAVFDGALVRVPAPRRVSPISVTG